MLTFRRRVNGGACRGNSRQRNVAQLISVGIMLLACWIYSISLKKTPSITMLNDIDAFTVQTVKEIDLLGDRSAKSRKDHDIKTNDGDAAPLESFLLVTLDVSKRVSCGANKCFFRLKKNRQVGYLSTLKIFGSERDWFYEMESSYYLANELQETHDIQHLLLDPPVKITISKELAILMNMNLWRESASENGGGSPPHYAEGATVVLQRASVAPEPHLLIGNSADKIVILERHLHAFVTSIGDKELFARQFARNMKVAKVIGNKKPCFLRDFQALVDIKGQIYHIDLDRCFELEFFQGMEWALSSPNLKQWLEAIDRIERQVSHAVAAF